MKYYLLFYSLIFLFIFCSCYDESLNFDHDIIQKDLDSNYTFIMNEADALDLVSYFINSMENSPATRVASLDTREVEGIVTFPKTRANLLPEWLQEFNKRFYIVNMKNDKGYAIISKDERAFPFYAILDHGRFNFNSIDSVSTSIYQGFIRRNKIDIERSDSLYLNKSLFPLTRSSLDDKTFFQIKELKKELFRGFGRSSNYLLKTRWTQNVTRPNIYLQKSGATYYDVYGNTTRSATINTGDGSIQSTRLFGCTPVAFGQVLYGLRSHKGVKDLCYSNGQPVLWDRMEKGMNPEVERFLGWITMNCSPKVVDITFLGTSLTKPGVMVHNVDAKNFIKKILGDYLDIQYDNCVIWAGDLNGFTGNNEGKKIAEKFYTTNKECFAIFTGSQKTMPSDYHSYVVDRMCEILMKHRGVIVTPKEIVESFTPTQTNIMKEQGLLVIETNPNRIIYHEPYSVTICHVNYGWGNKHNGYYYYFNERTDGGLKYEGNEGFNNNFNHNLAYTIITPK